jgi:hypothetical protein
MIILAFLLLKIVFHARQKFDGQTFMYQLKHEFVYQIKIGCECFNVLIKNTIFDL